MKIKYAFADETVEIEVSEEWGNILIDLDRQEYNNDHAETRRHCSLEAFNLDDALFPDDVDVEREVLEGGGCMTAKEYLSQAYRLDQRIDAKIAQVSSLNELATKCTATLSGMPRNPNRGGSTMADAITKIIDLQAEINNDIDRLVDLKREIVTVIKAVGNTEYQTLLEKRYLCFLTWEQIAVDMGYNVRHLYRIHEEALGEVVVPQ